MISRSLYWVLGVLVLVAGAWFAYTGMRQSGEDLQQKSAENSANQAADSNNPFKSETPFANVEADPFAKTKKVLNPFE